MLFVFLGTAAAALMLAGAQIWVISQHIRKMTYDSKPYIRHLPSARSRFFFMGDSTAVGTGAPDNTQSVAGYFGQDFPGAEIDNDSFNGRKVNELAARFPKIQGPAYDLVVVQIGANDIMKFTPFRDIDSGITAVIKDAKRIGRHVVILHSGNVGLAPVFIWPFDWIMTQRARAVRRLYMDKARECGVLYVDLFTERGNDLFLTDIPKFYSKDHLHPSGEGYRWWYQQIRATLSGAGVVL